MGRILALFLLLLICEQVLCAVIGRHQRSGDLHQCMAVTDPHIRRWHRTSEEPPSFKDCLKPGTYDLVKNRFVSFQIRVQKFWMVDVTINFLDGNVEPQPICTVISHNFNVKPSIDCQRHDIRTDLEQHENYSTLNVYYPAADFQMSTTQHTVGTPRHFNIIIYQPNTLVSESIGLCSTEHCYPDDEEVRGDETEQRPPPVRSIPLEMAREICRVHLDNYLNKIRRLSHQRSAHYNGTIRAVYDACVFDIEASGLPSAAEGSLEALMMEELAADSTDVESIYNAVNAGLRQAIDNLNEANRQSEAQVKRIVTQSFSLDEQLG